MKIGINLVGVSYNDGKIGRYRNYEDALEGFMTNVVNPLKEEGHDIFFYLFTYESPKKEDIIKTYNPTKSTFLDPNYNKMGGGEVLGNQMKIISLTYINSLNELVDEDLDLIISTRFDISFNLNPFKEFNFEFNKFNFLFREPIMKTLPLVSDTFYVFPYSMINNFIEAIIDMETNPHEGVNIAMHNMLRPIQKMVGEENVKYVCNEYYSSLENPFYKLTRHE
jgi:hypothetical protein